MFLLNLSQLCALPSTLSFIFSFLDVRLDMI